MRKFIDEEGKSVGELILPDPDKPTTVNKVVWERLNEHEEKISDMLGTYDIENLDERLSNVEEAMTSFHVKVPKSSLVGQYVSIEVNGYQTLMSGKVDKVGKEHYYIKEDDGMNIAIRKDRVGIIYIGDEYDYS